MANARSYAGRERRWARPSPLVVGLAGLVVAGIVFSTLCPIDLRPRLANPDVERFAAYFLLGGLVALAAGRRGLAGLAMIVVLAFTLEAAQGLAPGRDPALSDAIVKALGGVFGSAAGQLFFAARRMARQLAGRLPGLAARRETAA